MLVISGPSSSGKTSMARQLLDLLHEPAWLFVADDCYPRMQSSTADAENGLEPAIVVFHRAVAQWAASGRNVVIDGALPLDTVLRARCLDEFKNFRTHIVAVNCDAAALRRREIERPDARPLGWAEQCRDINDGLTVSVHIDTTSITPSEAAQQVVDWLADSGP